MSMLEEQKLENTYWDGRLVEKIGTVKTDEGDEHHQVAVTFADGAMPAMEVMHKEEWEAMKTDGPGDQERSYHFQAATYALQGRLMREVEAFNPRFAEVEHILQRIRFANEEVLDLALHGIFGKPMEEATFDDVEKAIEKGGVEPRLGTPSKLVLDLYDLIKSKNYPLAEVQTGFAQLFELMGSLKAQAIQAACGVPHSHLRLDHVIHQAEKVKVEDVTLSAPVESEA